MGSQLGTMATTTKRKPPRAGTFALNGAMGQHLGNH